MIGMSQLTRISRTKGGPLPGNRNGLPNVVLWVVTAAASIDQSKSFEFGGTNVCY